MKDWTKLIIEIWSQICYKVIVVGLGLLSKNIAKKYKNMKLSTIFGQFQGQN